MINQELKDKAKDPATTTPATPATLPATSATPATLPATKMNALAPFASLYQYSEVVDLFLIFLGTLGGIVTGVSIPFFNILFGTMINALNTDPLSFASRISAIALAFVYVSIINIASGTLQVSCWTIVGERQSYRIRHRYTKAILSQEIGWFDTCGVNELSSRVNEHMNNITDGTGQRVGDFIQYLSQFIASFIVALYLTWKLTVVLLTVIPFICFSGYLMVTANSEAKTKGLEQYAASGGIATESFNSIRTVTALNAQADIITKFRYHLLEAMKIGIKKGVNVGIGSGTLFGSVFCLYALGFWYAGQLVATAVETNCQGSSCITGGSSVSTFFAVILGSIALGQISPQIAVITAARASMHELLLIINRKPLIDGFADIGDKPEEKTKGLITLNNVQFAYPTRPNISVCKDYNLTIQPGETVALVGASGCGKSTIINLLLRFYDPQAGTVCIDGRNVTSLNVKWLRSQISLVSQEPCLFSGSIADNISYGLDLDLVKIDDGVTTEEYIRSNVIAAAKLANAHEFISAFPQGYDTDVGSNGTAMSGGQKQRIAIARALIKKPSILLLDEATSALDSTSEKIVQQSIDSLSASKAQTTLIIAHRLSTIRNADKICLISDGTIAEIGTHDQLISSNGSYADLIRLQISNDSDGDDDSMTADLEDRSASSSIVSRERKLSGAKATDIEAATATTTAADSNSDGGANVAKAVIPKEVADKLLTRVWKLIRCHMKYFVIAMIGSSAYGAVFPVWGLVLARSQNMFYYSDPDHIREQASQLSVYFVVLGIVALATCIIQYWAVTEVSERVAIKLRSDLFEATLRQEIAFFDTHEVSVLCNRIANDSRKVTQATGESTVKLLQAIFTLLIGLGIGFSASWKISMVVLAVLPIQIFAQKIRLTAISGLHYNSVAGGNINDLSAAFTHMRTVAAFSMQFKILSSYLYGCEQISSIKRSKSYLGGFLFGISNSTQYLNYALIFWYGSRLISSGEITFVNLMTAMLSLMLGAVGLAAAMNEIGDQQEGLEAAARIFAIIDEANDNPIDGLSVVGDRPTTGIKGGIELRNINFHYPTRPDITVCKDYNLTIEAGEVVALVGPSGSGKSTIMNLLLRFYDPISGQVFLDGQDIKSLNVRWLRSQIGYVGQEPALFSGSVGNNIAKGRRSFGDCELRSIDEVEAENVDTTCYGILPCLDWKAVEDKHSSAMYDVLAANDIEMNVNANEDIISACKASNAHEFITEFPQGYDTDVGEGSVMVSGGQKQRIAIARALIKKPVILLLDEATSALDAASERLVQQSIDELQQSKAQTTIVIAHRLSTIRNADKIAVIDGGKVVEVGKHDQLLASHGLYYTLWNKQNSI